MPHKSVILSPHARFEMQRRGISVSEVTNTVHCPEQIVPSIKRREIRQSRVGSRKQLLLRVVVKEAGVAYHVVTAYKTNKIAKYWVRS